MKPTSREMNNPREFLTRVRALPELYNTDHPMYNDVENRRRLWDQLGNEFQVTGDAARSKFKNCRDSYMRAIKAGKKSYIYQDILSDMVDVTGRAVPLRIEEPKVILADPDKNRTLILRVQCHPELYNGSDPNFKDKAHKSGLWTEIGEEVELSGDQARHRFRNIKDSYFKSLRSETKARYKYHDLLATFLTSNVQEDPLQAKAERLQKPIPSSSHYKFSVDLMKAVECRPVLYNGDDAKVAALQEIWEEVAENLGRSVTDCQQRYKTMKTRWCIAHNAGRPYTSGHGMEFLEPYLEVEAATMQSKYAAEGYAEEVIDEEEEPMESSDMYVMSDSGNNNQWDSEEDDFDSGTASGSSMAVQQQQQQNDNEDLQLPADADPLKLFFTTMYTTVRAMRAKNVLVLKKQIFDLVHEMQMKEEEESEP